MAKESVEIRSISSNISNIRIEERGDNLPSRIVGYTAVFDTPTEIDTGWHRFNEVIRKGAFTRALSEGQDVRALFNHDSNNVLGRNKSGTLTMREDNNGLWVEIVPPDTSLGRDVMQLISRGDISGMSFAFIIRKVTWSQGESPEDETREILDVDLFDVGPVTYPAYEETTAGVRSHDILMEERGRFLSDKALIPDINECLKNSLTGFLEGFSSGLQNLKTEENFSSKKIRERELFFLTHK